MGILPPKFKATQSVFLSWLLILAIRAASQVLGNWHLNDCTLYVTLEPCPMCAGAIIQARLGLLVYGADDPKTGVIRTVANFFDSPFSNHRLPVIAV